jgi:hypothetical protein
MKKMPRITHPQGNENQSHNEDWAWWFTSVNTARPEA